MWRPRHEPSRHRSQAPPSAAVLGGSDATVSRKGYARHEPEKTVLYSSRGQGPLAHVRPGAVVGGAGVSGRLLNPPASTMSRR
jgi:hypothetical protein